MIQAQKDPTLQDLLRVFRRRQNVFYAIVAACFFIASFLALMTTRRYEASGTIEIQKSSNDSLGLDSIMEGMSGGGSDSMGVNMDIQTQSSILQSRQIALNVINDLHLDRDPDFQPKFSLLGSVLSLISPSGSPDPQNAPLDESPKKRERLLAVFKKNLKVKVVAGTRLMEVDYSNPDPKVSKAVVDDLSKQLIDFSFQVRFRATTDASRWLEIQLGDLRSQTTDLQSRLVAVQKDTGLFGMGGTDMQGKPTIYSPALDRLQQATSMLTQAQSNRILKGAIYEAVRSGDAELVSQLGGTAIGAGTAPGIVNSLSLIQTLRSQQATVEAQIAQDSTKFAAAYPKLVEERASLAHIEQSLHDEIGRVSARARNDYEISQESEAGIRNTYDQAKAEAEKLNDKTIEYTILQRETNDSQELYQDLLKRLKEAGVVEGLHYSNLTVVDSARTPARPASPNIPLYLTLGAALGVFLGLVGAFLVDAIDNRVHSGEDVEALGLTLLGMLPRIPGEDMKSSKQMIDAPHSIFSEAMRSLASAMLISRGGLPPKILLVASAGPSEGKTTASLNLAIALSKNGRRVLLIEADMRRPVLRKRLELKDNIGLSQVLSSDDANLHEVLLPGSSNVWILQAGPIPPYPAELLSSARLVEVIAMAKERFDFVVFDSAPALPVVDVQVIAPHADSMLLVARSGQTARPSLQRAFAVLKSHSRNPELQSIGVVLNAVPTTSSAYLDYYGYKQYGYYRQETANEN